MRWVTERLRQIWWSIVMVVLMVAGVAVGAGLVAGIALSPIGIGRPLRDVSLRGLRSLADAHRLWATQAMGHPIARPYRAELPPVRDPATWRDVRWLAADLTLGSVTGALPAISAGGVLFGAGLLVRGSTNPGPGIVTPTVFGNGMIRIEPVFRNLDPGGHPMLAAILGGSLALVSVVFLSGYAMRGYVWLLDWFLGPSDRARLAVRIDELTRSRDDVVDTRSAEVRRIERDLHDGAQARLVSLGMNLGMVEKLFDADPAAARALLGEAKRSTGQALSELRSLVRGIHPPILADRGLEGAVRALAVGCAIPVELTIDLPGPVPAPVESAVYFALTELLANVAKHSGAGQVWISVSHADNRLDVLISDDGTGGASMPEGGGLHGIERRLAAFDGTMFLTSPVGGPTIVSMGVPCELACVSS